MKKRISKFGLALALASMFLSSASAGQVNTKDLVGRKICWDSGNISTFGPGGKYSSPVVGEGFWAVGPGGVSISTARFNGLMDIDKQPDGTFKSAREGGAGRYCK